MTSCSLLWFAYLWLVFARFPLLGGFGQNGPTTLPVTITNESFFPHQFAREREPATG